MTNPGHVSAICISREKGTVKEAVDHAVIEEGHGLVGDAHAGSWHRQVSLLASGDIEAMKAKGLPDLEPGAFGENLVVSSLDLSRLGLGSRLGIGDEVELRISQRGKVCHNRCAIYYRTGDCIMPRNGMFARVIRGGDAAVGNEVKVLEEVPAEVFQAAVLTISDKGARGKRVDTAGPAVARILRENLGANIYTTEIIPDEQETIAERLRHYSAGHSIDLVLAVGGTGFSPRDVTPEAILEVAERLTPGLDEVMRAASLRKTPRAMLSRAVSGIRGSTLLISLPGSEKAARENLEAVLPGIGHGLKKLRGDPEDCGAPTLPARLQSLGEQA